MAGKMDAKIRVIPQSKMRIVRFPFTQPLHSHGLASVCRSKRFASNALHTNMQVHAVSRDYSRALRKLHRFAVRREGVWKIIEFLSY
jgi:hypothetical protein